MESLETVNQQLVYLRHIHATFYREYVETGSDRALALSYRAKASYYRLRKDILEPVNVFHYN